MENKAYKEIHNMVDKVKNYNKFAGRIAVALENIRSHGGNVRVCGKLDKQNYEIELNGAATEAALAEALEIYIDLARDERTRIDEMIGKIIEETENTVTAKE